MATHSSILAWTIPWRQEPDGLQYVELQRVRQDLVTKQQQQLEFKVNLIKLLHNCTHFTGQQGHTQNPSSWLKQYVNQELPDVLAGLRRGRGGGGKRWWWRSWVEYISLHGYIRNTPSDTEVHAERQLRVNRRT